MDNRIKSIDFVKGIAIFWVIIGHTAPFRKYPDEITYNIWSLIHLSILFVIPYFFFISGYLLGKNNLTHDSAIQIYKKYILKLITLYISWSIIYILIPDIYSIWEMGLTAVIKVPYWRILQFTEKPILDLFEGVKVHLWYILSLMMTVTLFIIFIKLRREHLLLPLALIFYVFGVLGGSYSKTEIGFLLEFNTRNGLFYSTLPFVIGWKVSLLKRKISTRLSLFIITSGFVAICFEYLLLRHTFGISIDKYDYFFGSVVYGIGVGLLTISNNSIIKKNSIITEVGKYLPGIYLGHYIFVDLLKPIDRISNKYYWEIIYPFLVFVLTFIMIKLIEKNNLLKKFLLISG